MLAGKGPDLLQVVQEASANFFWQAIQNLKRLKVNQETVVHSRSLFRIALANFFQVHPMGWVMIVNLRRELVLKRVVLFGLPGHQKSDQLALLFYGQMGCLVFYLGQRHGSTLLPGNLVVNPRQMAEGGHSQKLKR
jgi:hypothetical protein